MSTVKIWISEGKRAETLKKQFTNKDKGELYSNIKFENENDGTVEITITNPSGPDLLSLFHAGIEYGIGLATNPTKM